MNNLLFWAAVVWVMVSVTSLAMLLFPGPELTPLGSVISKGILLSNGLIASVWVIIYLEEKR